MSENQRSPSRLMTVCDFPNLPFPQFLDVRQDSSLRLFDRFRSGAAFRSMHQLCHFPGGDVVVAKTGVCFRSLRQFFVEALHGFAEQHIDVAVFTAVGVELDEQPIGSSSNVHVGLHPQLESGPVSGMACVQIGILDAGHDSPFAPFPIESQRSLNHQQAIVRRLGAHRGREARVV